MGKYLIGIRLQVPQSWWPGYSGSELYVGAVQELDFSDKWGRYFLFEDDDDVDICYPIQYDAVIHYADEEQRGYARFRLPPNSPANPVNALLQRGPKVCMQTAEHPKHSRDLTKVFD